MTGVAPGSWIARWTPGDGGPARIQHTGPPNDPLVAVAGDPGGGQVAVEGYLFDVAELGAGRAVSDAAAAASAYARWADQMFDKLRGGFAIAVWDPGLRRLVVGRDAMGLVPCYYRWDGRTLLASPSADALLAEPDVDGRVDRLVLAEYLQNRFPPEQVGESFHAEIRRLPPASVLVAGERGIALSEYWQPVPPGFRWAGDAERAELVPALARAVRRCLDAGADSIALSGGFDSVSLAVLAGAVRPDGATPLHALCLRFPGEDVDEHGVQGYVAGALGMPRLTRSLAECMPGDLGDALLDESRSSPSPVPSLWQPAYGRLFAAGSALGLRRAILGTGGDDLFYVDPGWAVDRVAALDARGLWRFFRAHRCASAAPAWRVARHVFWGQAGRPWLGRFGRSVLARAAPAAIARIDARRRAARSRHWLAPGDPALAAAVEARIRPAAAAHGDGMYARAIRSLARSPLLQHELGQAFGWARRHGVTPLLPYFDRDVVDLSLRIHPDHLMAGGEPKAPLRRLVAERLPGASMPRRRVDVGRLFHEILRTEGQRLWAALGGARELAAHGIVSPARVNAAMARCFAGDARLGAAAWRILDAESWLRARSGMDRTRGRGRPVHG